MWIDINHDGAFDDAAPELIDNHWGRGNRRRRGSRSVALATGRLSDPDPVRGRRRRQSDGTGGRRGVRLCGWPTSFPTTASRSRWRRRPSRTMSLACEHGTPSRWTGSASARRRSTTRPEADGVTPRVHTVTSASRTITSARTCGGTLSAPPRGRRSHSGRAVESGWCSPKRTCVARRLDHRRHGPGGGLRHVTGRRRHAGRGRLLPSDGCRLPDDTPYAGEVVPEIGPYPLVQDVSFPWFEYTTFSSIASSIQGAFAHELGHAFGLPHDFRNDSNFRGTLMGNGLRGFRGAMYPERYPSDDMRLSYGAALSLNVSAYFNPGADAMTVPGPTS